MPRTLWRAKSRRPALVKGTSGERLMLAKCPNGILQCLYVREPQGCGSGIEAAKLTRHR